MNKNIIKFEKVHDVENIKEILKDIFDLDLDISGGWGYSQESALKVHKIDTSLEQFAHTFIMLRSNIEMNIMLGEEDRYSGLNVHVEDKKSISKNEMKYELISFKISATKIEQNKKFIEEYKENYGKENFDIQKHFQKRKEAEISRTLECWFDTTHLL